MKGHLALGLCLGWCALAQASPHEILEVRLHSQPPGAVVIDQFGANLGRADRPFRLDPSPYGDFVQFNFQMPGHKSALLAVPVSTLKQEPEIRQVVVLEANNSWVAFQDWAQGHRPLMAVILAGGALALAGLGSALARGHRALERERKIQQMTDRAGGTDSLLAARVGGWLLVEVLGRGGMATVYRGLPADSLDESQAVAVKVMGRQSALEAQDWERFRREIQICRDLNHPGIVKLIDYGNHESFLYLVLELVRGETLTRFLEAHPGLPVSEAWPILTSLFEAVSYAHERGVVHRDLKPDNVMLQPNGRVKVMDFGLAKATHSEKLTATGSVLGTPLYIAPEQIQGGQLDPRTDQYSLGVMVYEMLTGQVPFNNPDIFQLIMQHIQEAPVPPSAHRPELAPIDAVLLRMLSKKPEERFESLREALEQLRTGLGQ